MSEEANKAVVERFFHEMADQGRSELEPELFTEDCVRRFPGRSSVGYSATPHAPRNTSSFRTTIHEMIACGDRVVARLTHDVTYSADIPSFPRIGPIAAAGKSVSWDATVVFRFRDGKICEELVARDELGILQQLGVVPVGGQP